MTPRSSQALWTAVDAITRPTNNLLTRDIDDIPDWAAEFASPAPFGTNYCRVDDYRALLANRGRVASLWQQAEWAVTTGSESQEGGGVPLRERSVADLEILELVSSIRDIVAAELRARNLPADGSVPQQIRRLAAHLTGRDQVDVDWWAARFEQWRRILTTHLNPTQDGPRPVYLRNAPCPGCGARQHTVVRDGERYAVPAIIVDFRDGLIRAATCQACGRGWFRGDQLGHLADLLDRTA